MSSPSTIEALIDLLHTPGAGYTLALAPAGGGEPTAFTQRGVGALVELIDDPRRPLCGATVADRIVGRAAASLMILGGVTRLHTDVISSHALSILEGTPLRVTYATVTDHVINRDATGWCPLEMRCRHLATPAECRDAILAFLSSFSTPKQ